MGDNFLLINNSDSLLINSTSDKLIISVSPESDTIVYIDAIFYANNCNALFLNTSVDGIYDD